MRMWKDGSESGDYFSDIAAGRVPGKRSVHKFGQAVLSTADVKEDIWSYSGNYTWPTTFPHYISSSDDSDTQELIIEGIGPDFKRKIETWTLEGQTKKAIGDWYRIYRMKNNSGDEITPGVDFAGNIYAYEDDTVDAGVPETPAKITAYISASLDKNQTQMTVFTVPINERGQIWALWPKIVSRLTKAATGTILIRNRYGVFREQEVYSLNSAGTTYGGGKLAVPLVLEPLTDVIVTGTPSSNDLLVAFSYDMILEDIENAD